jgi:dihydroorotate dehydrogenase (NAD+) catalytic subunit
VIGMGGISSGPDAREFLAAGAVVVAVGTENFRDPMAGRRVASELSSGITERLDSTPILDLDSRSR